MYRLNVDEQTSKECIAALNNIPASETSLDISNNSLGGIQGSSLAGIFKQIPRQIHSLDISGNELWVLKPRDLIQALKAIPNTVTSLNISDNQLENKSAEELEGIKHSVSNKALCSTNNNNHFFKNFEQVDEQTALPALTDITNHPHYKS